MPMLSDSSRLTMSKELERHGSDESLAEIHALARGVVERALAGATRGMRQDADLQTRLRLTCAAARRRGLHAETVVLIVKDSWRNFADPHVIDRLAAEPVLRRLVTMCINEFYIESDDKSFR